MVDLETIREMADRVATSEALHLVDVEVKGGNSNQLLRVYIDGIPLGLAAKLLPGRSLFVPGLYMHVKLHGRMQELLGSHVDHDRILQEAAMLAERSDIQEEIVRMKNHIQHFLSLLDAGGEVGKKLDFLLQEMNREANTLMSKTTGVAGEALRITELGLAMKSEIEKAREQIQNLE